jgi:hypothetical protein
MKTTAIILTVVGLLICAYGMQRDQHRHQKRVEASLDVIANDATARQVSDELQARFAAEQLQRDRANDAIERATKERIAEIEAASKR